MKITVKCGEKVLQKSYAAPQLAQTVLEDLNFDVPHPCGGRGTCKKCGIILNGKSVLSCGAYIYEDSIIELENTPQPQGITETKIPETEKKPLADSGVGTVFDIGTTTVAAYAYELPSGKLIEKTCAANAQLPFGADVMTRIDRALCGGGEKLHAAIKAQTDAFKAKYNSKISVVTGNTVMLHFYKNADVSGLAQSPYTPKTLFGGFYGSDYLPRCISAFIGADVLCAMLACEIDKTENTLLADIGTNGETALFCGGKIYCCSAAAGPAFEGASLACGMPYSASAIDTVFLENGEFKFTAAGGETPRGICGSGFVDAAAAILKAGVLSRDGYLKSDFYLTKNVYISPRDIRSLQMAKSAIRSGIDALLEVCGITAADVSRFVLSGGFGSRLNLKSAAEIGVFPQSLADKAVCVGNGAAAGAAMLLQNSNYIEKSRTLAEMAVEVPLASNEKFMQKYLDNMSF